MRAGVTNMKLRTMLNLPDLIDLSKESNKISSVFRSLTEHKKGQGKNQRSYISLLRYVLSFPNLELKTSQ